MDALPQAIFLGSWFGLLHAFDADHLATIGGLAVRDRSLSPAGYALRWACGHAAALVAVGAAVLGAGLTQLLELSAYAELVVCAVLLVLGVQALNAARRSLSSPRALRAHVADTAPGHLHFLAPSHSHVARRGRSGVLMGLLHGGAGSAAVLALVPLARFDTGVGSALYLACFSAGVALGALAFARVFAAAANRSATASARLGAAFQAAVGIVAITSGALLLYEITHGGG